jgi:hypothetical protein
VLDGHRGRVLRSKAAQLRELQNLIDNGQAAA